MTSVYLSLGSNIGNRLAYLKSALQALAALPKTDLVGQSSFYETKAWGKTDQADFLNMACQLETQLSAHQLLYYCQKIEQVLKRERKEHWGPRTIDIDLLFYGQEQIVSPRLTIPHPYLQERAFVLVPLAELNPNVIHPLLNQSIKELLKKIDVSGIVLYSSKDDD